MTADTGTRLVALVVLGIFGVGSVLVGPSLGIAAPMPDADRGMTVTVSESNVTLEEGDRRVVVAEDIETTETVEVTRSDGHITVRTDDPLTKRDRTRAIEIAKNNETVRNALAGMDDVELVVEPIVRLENDAIRKANVDIESIETANTTSSGELHRIESENTSVQKQGDSVTIHRNRSYVEDRAVVRVRSPASHEGRNTVRVDLANETVVDIYD